MHGVNLTKANLSNCGFWGADLSDANLNGANVKGIVLLDANLTGARLTSLEALDLQAIEKAATLYKAEMDPYIKEYIQKVKPELLQPPRK